MVSEKKKYSKPISRVLYPKNNFKGCLSFISNHGHPWPLATYPPQHFNEKQSEQLCAKALRCTWSCNPKGVQLKQSPALLVSSYLTFSPLPQSKSGRLFSATLLYFHKYLPIHKYGALHCPDFPLLSTDKSDRPACYVRKSTTILFNLERYVRI